MNETLLVELLFEEVPHNTIIDMSQAFPAALIARLSQQGLITDATAPQHRVYATPRRLAVQCTPVRLEAAARTEKIKLMPTSYAKDPTTQNWTPAFLKKMLKLGLKIQHTEALQEENGIIYYEKPLAPYRLADHLSQILSDILLALPIKNKMYWGTHNGPFIRPIRHTLAILGETFIPCPLWQAPSTPTLYGHRTLSHHPIALTDANQYENILETHGTVIPCQHKRRTLIEQSIAHILATTYPHAQVLVDDMLMSEIVHLVEYPQVLLCHFPASFLLLPEECLILILQKSQRYLPLRDHTGQLLNAFLVIINMPGDPCGLIAQGAEKVVIARLSDALFFFHQDQNTSFEQRQERLRQILYHEKLGSLYDLQHRITQIAQLISNILNLPLSDKQSISTASRLLKIDLTTEMVKEFPELQGIMGQYYAEKAGYPAEICQPIAEHYHPIGKETDIPTNPISRCIAIAHKTEHLISFFSIKAIPTGDRDPFGLRRAAIALIRLLSEQNLTIPLHDFLYTAASVIQTPLQQDTINSLYEFLKERCFFYWQEKSQYTSATIKAILNTSFDYPYLMPQRMAYLNTYQKTEAFAHTLSTYKRIRNLLKHVTLSNTPSINIQLLNEPEEKALFDGINQLVVTTNEKLYIDSDIASTESSHALTPIINTFLDRILIHVNDKAIKENRIALLTCTKTLLTRLIDWEAFIMP